MDYHRAEARHIYHSANRLRDERLAEVMANNNNDDGCCYEPGDYLHRIFRCSTNETTAETEPRHNNKQQQQHDHNEDDNDDEDASRTALEREEEERRQQEKKRAAGLLVSLEKFSEPTRHYRDRQLALLSVRDDAIKRWQQAKAVRERVAALNRIKTINSNGEVVDEGEEQSNNSVFVRFGRHAPSQHIAGEKNQQLFGVASTDLPPANIVLHALTDSLNDSAGNGNNNNGDTTATASSSMDRSSIMRLKASKTELRREFTHGIFSNDEKSHHSNSSGGAGDHDYHDDLHSFFLGGGGNSGAAIAASLNMSAAALRRHLDDDETAAINARKLRSAVLEATINSRMGGRDAVMPSLATLLQEQREMERQVALFSDKTTSSSSGKSNNNKKTGHAAIKPMLLQHDPAAFTSNPRVLALVREAKEIVAVSGGEFVQ